MDKLSAFVMCCITLFSGFAFAGTNITGTGDTVAQACWNYNYKANKHARVNSSCWGKCIAENVTKVNNKFVYTFNNPNNAGSCPKPKYNGGSGKRDKDFYAAYAPPPGIANPYAAPATPETGAASYSFRNHFPAANHARLNIQNTSNSEVRYECEIKRKTNGVWGRYGVEIFIIQPKNSVEKGYHSFDKVDWSATCKKV